MAVARDHFTNCGASISSGTANTITSSTGNCLLVFAAMTNSGVISSVVDSKSNPYALVAKTTNGSTIFVEVWMAKAATTGVTSVTVTFSGGGTAQILVYDLSGADANNPLGATAILDGTAYSATNLVGPRVGHPGSNGIVISWGHFNAAPSAVGGGFTGDLLNTNNAAAYQTFSTGGSFTPSWTFGTSGLGVVSMIILPVANTYFTNIRTIQQQNSGLGSALTTAGLVTQAGDLVVLAAGADSGHGVATPYTDNQSGNTYNMVTGMNPISSPDSVVFVGYGVLVNGANSHTFTFNHTSNGGNAMQVIVVTPLTGTPTYHTSNTGTVSPSNTAHAAATATVAANDFLVAGISAGYTTITSLTANGSWLLSIPEKTQMDGNTYEPGLTEFQLSAAGGSTHDDFTTAPATTSCDFIVAFSPAITGPAQFLIPGDMTPGSNVVWEVA